MADFAPHAYQVPAMQWLQDKPRSVLWMPMGGGKTVTTLTALDQLTVLEDVYPMLVLAPLRVARSTWPEEVQKWGHLRGLTVSPITGSDRERRRAAEALADIYTMNYENLPWLVELFGDAWPFKTVVADELTRLKGYRTRQGSKRAAALAKVAHSRVSRFVGLTGTPSPNGLQDLWGQIWFVDRGERLGRSYAAYLDRWFTTGYNGYDILPRPGAEEEIHARLRDICLTVDALPVDEPIHNHIWVDLPPRAAARYKEMEDQLFTELESGAELEAVNGAAKTMKCLQLANGAAYVDENGNWEGVHDAKLEALDSVIEEANGAPVLVAYHFKSDLARLKARYPRARVLDKDPATIKAWNKGQIPLLLAHPASAGHGLNLAQGGNILAFFSLNWSLEEHMQIIERIGPMRQKQAGLNRPVTVHYIVARKTVDRLLIERLKTKRKVQDILLEAMKERKRGGR